MKKQLFTSLMLSAILMCTFSTLHAAIRYVKPTATGTTDGSSWANASANLQAMINASAAGDEVWVAAGAYKPTTGTDRTIAFRMKNGVGIYGGFFGNETERNQRNFNNNITTLSGDLNGDDVISGSGVSLNISNNSENSYVVVSNDFPMDNPLTTSAILDGFTIRGGCNQESLIGSYNAGAGMRNLFASPTLSNIIMIGNRGFYGGGMFNSLNSSPVLTNVTFQQNSSQRDGGGMHNYTNANVVLNNVTFTGNLSFGSFGGGATANFNNSPTYNNCRFSGNFATHAGAISNIGVNATFTNCSFTNNGVFQDPGCIWAENSTLNFFNCIFSGNRANLYSGVMSVRSATVNVTNCVFWDNSAGSTNPYNQSGLMSIDGTNPVVTIKNSIIWSNQSLFLGVQPTITNSIVQGDYTGTGNLNADPLFANAANPIGGDGVWGTADDGFRLQFCSWAVNTGNNAGVTGADFAGSTRIFNTTVDMGAYELQSVVPTGNTTFYRDQDGDGFGFGNAAITTLDYCTAVGYVANNTDCNDNNLFINPGSAEVCDGLDNNCNNQTDEGVQMTYYQDQDGDGFGNAAISTLVYCPPTGYVANNTDCNDNNPVINPGFAEICDGLDNNCNGTVDEVTANCAIAGIRTWTGALSTNWNTACNWSPACVPTAADDAVIPSATNQPIISATGAVAKSVHVQSGASLTISASGTLTINGSRSLDNAISGIYNQGTMTNNGALTLGSTSSVGQLGLRNAGTFNNNPGANTRIDRSSSCGISNQGIFTNAASIIIGGGAGVSNFGIFNQATFNNTSCAEISMFARFFDDAGLFSNAGLIRCNTTATPHFNVFGFTNEGIIVYPQGNPIQNVTNNNVIAQPISGSCAIANALQIGGAVSFTVGTTWYLDENLTSTAGTYHQATNTFSPTNLPTGTPTTVYFSVTDNINACIRTVSIVVTYSSGLTWYQDLDGDTYGNPAVSQMVCQQPTGYVANNTDCDDSDPLEKPGQTWYADLDNDGYGNGTNQTQCLRPAGYKLETEMIATTGDCNDNAAAINPGATEVCDGMDNNCDNQTDEGVQTTYYRDQDGDGFGNAAETTLACSAPNGYLANNTDCDDNDPLEKPGQIWYGDLDNDGYGTGATQTQCLRPAGYKLATEMTATTGDCNDNAAAINPGATEVCDGMDNNCDNQTDEGVQTTYYRDQDGDGFGNPSNTTQACSLPAGYVTNNQDCNDNNSAINPGAAEVCGNDLDDNCNGQTDEGCCDLSIGQVNAVGETCPNQSNGNITVAATSSSGPINYSIAGSVNQSNSTGIFTNLPAGNYNISVTDGLNCSAQSTAQVAPGSDNTPPTLVCKNTTVFTGNTGTYTLQPADVFNATASSDNCSGTLTVTNISPAMVSCAQLNQTIPVTVTVQDASGNMATCTAQITVQEGSALPAGWNSDNVGNANGGAGYKACSFNGSFTVAANGFSTSSTDVLHFAYVQLCGNGEIIARVMNVSGGGWAGIMLRESLAAGSKKAALKTPMTNIVRREIRSVTNGATSMLNLNRPQHVWLRLVRNGSNFIGYTSVNGSNWDFAFSATVSMAGCIYAGVFAESINTNTTTTASFSNVSIIGAQNNFALNPELQVSDLDGILPTLEVNVFPNPTSGVVNMNFVNGPTGLLSIQVFNTLGESILLKETDGADMATEQLDLSDLAHGVYFITVHSEGYAPLTKRVVLAK